MDDDPQVVANRRNPIPVVEIPSLKDIGKNENPKRTRPQSKDRTSNASRQSLQERLFSGIISQIIPIEELDEDDSSGHKSKTADATPSSSAPNFSLPIMSTNFRRFNARIGVAFVLQERLTYLFSWQHPTGTLSFLAAYSLLSLNPHLLPAVPLIATLLFVMVPSFLTRHPPPPNESHHASIYHGPPVAPAARVEPAPEMSQDFFRNMRDLQNSMEDFSRVHDAVTEDLAPLLNFSDEKFSSALFGLLCILSCAALLGSWLVPWRAIALVGGWVVIGSGHPRAHEFFSQITSLQPAPSQMADLGTTFQKWVEKEVLMDAPPERRQVEIFELQKWHAYTETWEPWLFSPSPYDLSSPARLSGARAKGTQFFEEVQPPSGWAWKDKKWTLDLFPREWVEQRMITDVEIELDAERWVYDVPDGTEGSAGLAANKGSSSEKNGKTTPKSGWEEARGNEKRGEWRRRRWMRRVERLVMVNAYS